MKDTMNVLMVVLNNVTHDNRVLKSAQSLKKVGHNVEIYGISKERGIQTKPKLERTNGQLIRLFPNPRYFLYGCKTAIDSWRFMIEYFSTAMKVFALKLEPQIVYTHDYNTLAIGKQIVEALRKEGKFVYWVHDLHEYVEGLTTTNDDIRNAALEHEQLYIHLPDCLMTVSPMLAKLLREKYHLERSPNVIFNAPVYESLDSNYHPTVRESVGLASDIPVLVYIGGVAQARGVHTAVQALPMLPDVHLVLVTNNQGEYIEKLKSFSENQRCSHRLHIVPYVPPEKVSSFVRDATIAIHPMIHYPNAEIALPNKLFEYMHSGVPIIVSDCESMSRFVRKWKIGEVFAAEDVDDFVRAVRHVLGKKDLYTTHLREFKMVNQRFSWESQSNMFVRLQKEIDITHKRFSSKRNLEANTLNDQYDVLQRNEEEASSEFALFYDSELTDILFSKYYFCCGQNYREKGDLANARLYTELSALFGEAVA